MSTNPSPAVLVLVTNQHSCERLIRSGKSLLSSEQQLRVLSIQPRKEAPVSNDALEHLFSVSCEMGAEMAIYYSDSPVDTASMYIKRHPIARVVVGANPEGTSMFITSLHAAFPTTPISIVLVNGAIIDIG